MRNKKEMVFYSLHNEGVEDPTKYIGDLYTNGMSCDEIAEHLHAKHSISITAKGASYHVHKAGAKIRTKQEAKVNAMKRGRMVYTKKPENEKYKAKSIAVDLRVYILKRDKHMCGMCGNSPKTGYTLEIHHIEGPESTPDNLQVLCFQCHRGMHLLKRDEKKFNTTNNT